MINTNVYVALRLLELALNDEDALKEYSEIASDALGTLIRTSDAIDAYEIAYPELKTMSPLNFKIPVSKG